MYVHILERCSNPERASYSHNEVTLTLQRTIRFILQDSNKKRPREASLTLSSAIFLIIYLFFYLRTLKRIYVYYTAN